MDEVYVTDHNEVDKKYLASNENEEQEFFNYEKSVEDYNNEIP